MHLHARLGTALAVASALTFVGLDARADGPPLGLSVSLERAAGVAYTSFRPTGSDTAYHGTMFSIAGPAINPVSLPRAAADVILPIGLTFGGAVGVGVASLSVAQDGGASSSLGANAWLLSPRIGYLVHLGSRFDLWPRVGVTFAHASLQEPDSQDCFASEVNGTTVTSHCTTTPGESDSFFFVAASLEVAAALRLTDSFNLLGGVSYDQVFSATGSSSGGRGGNTSSDLHAEGSYLGAQLWFGLGGYVR